MTLIQRAKTHLAVTAIAICFLFNSSASYGQKLSKLIIQDWKSSAWDSTQRFDYQYPNNQVTDQIRYGTWQGKWVKSTKYSDSVNTNDDPALHVIYTWNPNSETWTYNTRMVYFYKNELLDYVSHEKPDGIWKRSQLDTHTYNAKNQLVLKKSILFDDERNPYYKDSFVYDNNLEIVRIRFNLLNNETHRQDSLSFSHDAKGNIISVSKHEYHRGDNKWLPQLEEDHTYNNDEQLTSIVIRTHVDGNWINSTKFTYTYENGNIKTRLTQTWGKTTLRWTNAQRYLYEYGISSSVNDHEKDAAISLFPNPARIGESVAFHNLNPETSYECSLYDLQGRLLTATENTVDISFLKPGTYVSVIASQKEIVNRKKMIVR